MLNIETENERTGSVSLAGSLTRQDVKENLPVDKNNTHISNIGRMVEDMEIRMRGLLDTIYFGKTKDVVNSLRKKVCCRVLSFLCLVYLIALLIRF